MVNTLSTKKARENFEYCLNTIQLKDFIEHRFLELGKRLYDVHRKELYLPNYETFEEFCLELKMSRATISKLLNIYQKFVLEYKLSPKLITSAGGWSVVAETLTVVTSKKSAEKWLNIATHTSRNDLRKEIREQRTGINEYDCKHKKDHYTLKICRECGFRHVLDDTRDEAREKNKQLGTTNV